MDTVDQRWRMGWCLSFLADLLPPYLEKLTRWSGMSPKPLSPPTAKSCRRPPFRAVHAAAASLQPRPPLFAPTWETVVLCFAPVTGKRRCSVRNTSPLTPGSGAESRRLASSCHPQAVCVDSSPYLVPLVTVVSSSLLIPQRELGRCLPTSATRCTLECHLSPHRPCKCDNAEKTTNFCWWVRTGFSTLCLIKTLSRLRVRRWRFLVLWTRRPRWPREPWRRRPRAGGARTTTSVSSSCRSRDSG
mmetsp:Transcript_22305/g.52853  ORF Transcript_22305/g.52853 Transcript_22305/m.52853 type:complete len:245 (-) Transcript_22305:66-800(-)